MEPLLKVENLTFGYDEDILKDLSLTVQAGEIVSLLGVNGAGKSTLLKNINGLLRPRRGKIFLEGQDMTTMAKKAVARVLAYVSQYNEPISNTVYDTILMGRVPHIQTRPKPKDYQIVEDIIDQMGLRSLSLKKTSKLSGGQYQLVVLARALAQEPRLILLDEPTSNLDIKNQLDAMKLICSFCKDKGISVMLSIHDINLALQFSDKFILLKSGRIYDYGKSAIINPKSIKDVYGLDVDCLDYKGRKILVNL